MSGQCVSQRSKKPCHYSVTESTVTILLGLMAVDGVLQCFGLMADSVSFARLTRCGRGATENQSEAASLGENEMSEYKFATDGERDEIVAAVEAAGVYCPEMVCDRALEVASQGGDWRQVIAAAKAADDAASR